MTILDSITQFIPENNRLERIWKLAQVDFKKRYYNDRFGILWALINPLVRVGIYYIVFSILMNRGGAGIPNFALFIFSALIFWMEFIEITKKGMKVMYQKKYLIENIQVEKIDFYYSLIITSILGITFNLLAFFIFSFFFNVKYSLTILYLPILILNVYLISIGIAMILGVIFIFLKDLDHIYDLSTMLLFWTSGVFFDPLIIKEEFIWYYYLNPFLGLFSNIRAAILYNSTIDFTILIVNLITGIVVFSLGNYLIKNYSFKLLEKE